MMRAFNTRVGDIGVYEILSGILKSQWILASQLYHEALSGTLWEGINVNYYIFENLCLSTFKHF